MKLIKLQPKVKTTIRISPIIKYTAITSTIGVTIAIIILMIKNMGTPVATKANTSINLIDYEWQKTITINTGAYQKSDLYDFVYQINIADPDFMSVTNGGKIYQNDASDIVFIAQNENRVKFKIKKYNPINGNITLWLKLDTLKANENNTINMYFGNSNPTIYNDTIWDDNYVTYWDFDETYINNSLTSYTQIVHNQPSFKSSLNINAINIEGDPEYIHINQNNNLSLGAEGTLISWININDFKDYGGIIHKGDKKDFSDEEYSLQLWNNKRLLFAIFDDNTSKKLFSSELEKSEWYYVVATWSSDGMKIFINGVLDAESNETLITKNKNSGLNIGAQLNQNFNNSLKRIHFDGLIDETSILKSSINADFASVSYAMSTKSSEMLNISETKSKIITLPVELVDLKGISENNNIILSWFTMSEINNSGFYIQHSADGTNYSEIGFVNGRGTVNNINYYSFTYPNSDKGVSYYKLMQVDIDGKFKFYGPISVNNSESYNIEINTIYPDPFIDELKIDLTSNVATSIKVKLIDLNGRELTTDLYYIDKGYNTINLKNVSTLQKGIFSLSIFDETSMFFSGKVVKR